MSKVTKDQYIKDLEDDMDTLGSMVTELREDNKKLKKDLENLVLRIPSGFLTGLAKKYPNDFNLGGRVRKEAQLEYEDYEYVDPKETDGLEVGPWEGMLNTDDEGNTWIYESPDGGKTLYRRKFGDYDNKKLFKIDASQEEMHIRIKHLKMELVHEGYHDGWVLKGMKEELECLEKQIEPQQLDLFDE